MQEIDEIKFICKNFGITIIVFIILIATIFYAFFYFNLWSAYTIKDIKENVKQAAQFNGYQVLNIEPNEASNQKSPLLDPSRLHSNFIVYGAMETGKTTFMKKYISSYYKPENVFIYCKNLKEWGEEFPNMTEGNVESLAQLEEMETFAGSKENRNLIILDDMGNLIPQKLVSSIYTKGRHFYIQIIVLAHKPKDVDNKIRENVKIIYVTTGNSSIFFSDLNSSYCINMPFTNFKSLDYGLIEVNLIKELFTVYDENLNIFYDSNSSIRKVSPSFNIVKYLNCKEFTKKDKNEIILFLETESKYTINITDETFLFYLNYYFVQVLKLQPNFSKLTKMVTESKSCFTIADISHEFTDGVKSVKPALSSVTEVANIFG